MEKYFFSPEDTKKLLEPKDLGLLYTSLQQIDLSGNKIELGSNSEELCVVVIEGDVQFSINGINGKAVECDMLYIPLGDTITLCSDNALIVRYGAPASKKTEFVHIPFVEVDNDSRHKRYGKVEDGTKREVWNYIDEQTNSSRFLVGICKGAPGAWTAWPPHKHGEKREEVYYYFGMGDGFGVQCVYDDINKPKEVALVRNGDVIAIKEGYHPNVGCPKTGIKYVYCMVSVKEGDRNFMDLEIQQIYGDKLE